MEQVNIHAAKTHFSKLVARAGNGESVVIAKNGEPVAKLIPFTVKKNAPRIGFMKDAFTIPDDFDTAYADEIASMFEGGRR
jgi:prevent-host-death family protein